MDPIIKEGTRLLIYRGLIPLFSASFFEMDNPKNTDMDMRNPYHFILIIPKLMSSEPGDLIKEIKSSI